MINGLTHSLTSSASLQAVAHGLFHSYFALSRPWTIQVYEQMIESWKKSPVRHAPILYFFSHNDPMCDVKGMEGLIAEQREDGFTVFNRWWQVSKHAQHLKQHQVEYLNELNHLLTVVDPTNENLHPSKL